MEDTKTLATEEEVVTTDDLAVDSETATETGRRFDTARLMDFINRYYLGGNVEHVKWETDDNRLMCDFISADQSVVGSLTLHDFPLEDTTVGIYDTAKLMKLMKILDGTVDIDVEKAGDKAVAIHFEDDHKEINFRLGELSIIPETPKLKQLPDFTVSITLDDQFIADFISSERALDDSTTFAVQSDGTVVDVVVGYSQMGNTNKVVLNPAVETAAEVENVMFDSSIFREILSANRGSETATWEVSEQGLSRITFDDGDYEVTYYFVAKSEGI